MARVFIMTKIILVLNQRFKLLCECLNLFIKRNDSNYNFSLKDIFLYYFERTNKKSSIKEEKFNKFDKITISNTSIIWPKSINNDALVWLYHEVFDPYKINPSSYDNPNLGIDNKNWIIDAGASEGYYLIFSKERSKKETKIFAIEPISIMHKALLETVKLNNIKNFKLLPFALGDCEDEVLLELDYDRLCDSNIKKNNFLSSDKKIENIKQKTIDVIIKEQNISGNGLIKMDIEGFEMNALKGAEKTLKHLKPSLAIAVYHEYENALKCKEIIKKANPDYHFEFRGCYGYYNPARPYMLFAY